MNDERALWDAKRLTAPQIYEVIRRDGDEELQRPARSLIWAGVAAGILISFSVVGEAILRTYLPDVEWAYLVENLGYSLGFLLVILGRLQLFTENTITTVLPLVKERSKKCMLAVLRLWSIVLCANIVGTAVAALFIVQSGIFSPGVEQAIQDLSHHAMSFAPMDGLLRAIPAGVLIAAIVWMMPGQASGEVVVIIIFTWMIAAGDFTHIIAGSVEMWTLIFQGELGLKAAATGFFVPVLIGNIIGGTLVFTLLAWGQVKDEIEKEQDDTIEAKADTSTS